LETERVKKKVEKKEEKKAKKKQKKLNKGAGFRTYWVTHKMMK
jgi:hypothetical protein